MLTRHGVAVVVGGVAALVVGRVFAIVELFVLAAACFAAAALAVAYVRLRRPRVAAVRWLHPSVIVAGDSARVDLHLEHRGAATSPAFELVETIDRVGMESRRSRLSVAPMAARLRSTTGYTLPGASRGIIHLGPLAVELCDPAGIARSATVVAGIDELVVAPRATLLDIPQLGQGLLGAALLDRARRLGPGEFLGLREYADGDEPRSIDWKASARVDALMVKEHTAEGLQRCTVLLDAAPGSYGDPASFERAVTAAASLVHSAARAGLATRFVTAGGVDLRGPEVATNALRVLARIEPDPAPAPSLDRDAGDGLGISVVISSGPHTPAWRSALGAADPTVTALLVSTESVDVPRLAVLARTEEEFVTSWQRLVGRGRLDLVESS
jgi:uncharacterized protein (DUF58 family)